MTRLELKKHYIDYTKYQFLSDGMYAFGRLIEFHMGNLELVEVFSYVGEVSKSPEIILSSGRMFEQRKELKYCIENA